MKKLVLSLLGAATLATASNAMALDTTAMYQVQIQTRGLVPTFSGVALFDFDSQAFNVPGLDAGGFPGSCVYSMEWISNNPFTPSFPTPLALSAQCFVQEQLIHGATSCVANALRPVPTILQALTDPHSDVCDGFNPFGQFAAVQTLQLGEEINGDLNGVVQFLGLITPHTIYGVRMVHP